MSSFYNERQNPKSQNCFRILHSALHPFRLSKTKHGLGLLGFGFTLSLGIFSIVQPSNVFAQDDWIDCTLYKADDFRPILRKSINLARQAAERANGGLSKYRAEGWTQSGEAPPGTCFVKPSERSLSLRIVGGSPGWQQFGERPTIKSVIRIYPYQAEAKIVFESNSSI
jgi:hypothetical protein